MNSLCNKYNYTKYLTFILFAIITYVLLSLCVVNWPSLPQLKNVCELSSTVLLLHINVTVEE